MPGSWTQEPGAAFLGSNSLLAAHAGDPGDASELTACPPWCTPTSGGGCCCCLFPTQHPGVPAEGAESPFVHAFPARVSRGLGTEPSTRIPACGASLRPQKALPSGRWTPAHEDSNPWFVCKCRGPQRSCRALLDPQHSPGLGSPGNTGALGTGAANAPHCGVCLPHPPTCGPSLLAFVPTVWRPDTRAPAVLVQGQPGFPSCPPLPSWRVFSSP